MQMVSANFAVSVLNGTLQPINNASGKQKVRKRSDKPSSRPVIELDILRGKLKRNND